MTEVDTLVPAEQRLIDADEVFSVTSMRRTTLYAAIKHDNFPLPIQLGRRRVAWKLGEVLAWVDSRPRGTRPVGGKGAQA